MKKRTIIKTFTTLTCGLVATSFIPTLTTSCGSKHEDAYKPENEATVTKEMTEQFELMLDQIEDMIVHSELVPKELHFNFYELNQVLKGTVIQTLKTISEDKRIDVTEDKDPLEMFQQVLVLFHDPVMSSIEKLCNSDIVKFLFSEDSINNFIDLWDGILSNEIDLEIYAKSNWSLQDLFENVLYPLFDTESDIEIARKKAWELIWSLYTEAYYSGINYDHENGRLIEGEYKLAQKPTYTDKYDWAQVKRGDIMFSGYGFELAGHFSGHCGIVDGWESGITKDGEEVTYLRVIEANQFGVCYNLIDDTRMKADNLTILHIKDATDSQIEAATQFCEAQLGKDYSIPIFLSEDVNPDAGAWYCSELVWAGYMNQGINIQSNDYYKADIPGILPWEILYYENAQIVIQYQK